jgi:spore germination cell wall hydrolase CwlJ-like protein
VNDQVHASAFDAPLLLAVPSPGDQQRNALALIVVALILVIVAGAGLAIWKSGQNKLAATILLKPSSPPPLIEPVELKQIAPEEAKLINAAVPLSKAPIPSARPFRINGSQIEIDRAIDCLASAIYYEAGAEALTGQKAVAQVIINRVRHPAFPSTICGVVYQGSTRTTGCQFSFSCDGSMRRVPSAGMWAGMRKIARTMLTGTVYAPVGLATHYHTDWVVPYWSANLDKIAVERTHLFYRWKGWWGTPPAFRSHWDGNEPQVSKLAALSPAHAQTLDGEVALDAGAPPLAELPVTPVGKPVYANAAGDFMIFLIDKRSDPSLLADKALLACGGGPYCKVMMWTDRTTVPTALPISDAQLASLAFSYLRNGSSGYEKALWNCDIFKRSDSSQCMKPRAALAGAIIDRTASTAPGSTAPRPKDNTALLLPADPEDGEAPVVAKPVAPAADRTAGRRRPGG